MIGGTFSDFIKATYDKFFPNGSEKFDESRIKLVRDEMLVIDFESLCKGSMCGLTDDERKKAEELICIFESEILRRMNKWRKQARVYADEVYERLAEIE